MRFYHELVSQELIDEHIVIDLESGSLEGLMSPTFIAFLAACLDVQRGIMGVSTSL